MLHSNWPIEAESLLPKGSAKGKKETINKEPIPAFVYTRGLAWLMRGSQLVVVQGVSREAGLLACLVTAPRSNVRQGQARLDRKSRLKRPR